MAHRLSTKHKKMLRQRKKSPSPAPHKVAVRRSKAAKIKKAFKMH